MRRVQRLLFRAAAKTIAFRAETWLWLVLEAVPMVILLLIWQGIYGTSTELKGVQFSSLIFYYIFVFIIEMTTAAHFESWRITEIREGKIDFYLAKPLGYISELFTRHLGDKLMSSVLKLPLFLLFFLIIIMLFHPILPSITFNATMSALFILGGAFIMQFCFSAINVLLGFWLENAEGFDHFRWLTISLLSGIVIPFAFMPPSLLKLAELLPFKYLHSVPVLVLLGQQSAGLGDYLYLFGSCVVLIGVTALLWKKARMHYSAYGG